MRSPLAMPRAASAAASAETCASISRQVQDLSHPERDRDAPHAAAHSGSACEREIHDAAGHAQGLHRVSSSAADGTRTARSLQPIYRHRQYPCKAAGRSAAHPTVQEILNMIGATSLSSRVKSAASWSNRPPSSCYRWRLPGVPSAHKRTSPPIPPSSLLAMPGTAPARIPMTRAPARQSARTSPDPSATDRKPGLDPLLKGMVAGAGRHRG